MAPPAPLAILLVAFGLWAPPNYTSCDLVPGDGQDGEAGGASGFQEGMRKMRVATETVWQLQMSKAGRDAWAKTRNRVLADLPVEELLQQPDRLVTNESPSMHTSYNPKAEPKKMHFNEPHP